MNVQLAKRVVMIGALLFLGATDLSLFAFALYFWGSS